MVVSSFTSAKTARGLVLFDLDNTLLDRDAAFAKWALIFINHHDLDCDAWTVIASADEEGLRPRDQFFNLLRTSLSIKASTGDLLDAYTRTATNTHGAIRSTTRRLTLFVDFESMNGKPAWSPMDHLLSC